MSNHVLGNVHGDEFLAVMDRERMPDELRQDRRTARPRADDFLFVLCVHVVHLLHQVVIDERPFMYGTTHELCPLPFLALASYDPLIRALVVARLESARRL